MGISLNWIKQYVKTDLPAKEIAKRLTMVGLEVEAMQVIGGGWEGIIVGQILTVAPHPNADRLHLVTVDLGTRTETVVCGAPNVAIGAKIAYAPNHYQEPRELGRRSPRPREKDRPQRIERAYTDL